MPINGKGTLGVTIKARDESLAARVQDWRLTSEDGKLSVATKVKFNAAAKTLELAPDDPKLTPGEWKLTGQWDWSPLTVGGRIQLRPFSKFEKAHLTAMSHDRLTQSSGKCLVDLEGDDFEFVDKLAFKSADDKFAQPATLPFHLHGGTLETQLDPKSLGPGQYRFLIAQSDGKEHEVPFKVLPAAPEITNLPLMVNTGDEAEEFTLKGTGLERIEGLSADRATVTLGNAGHVTIKLEPSVRQGERIALQMKVKDFEQPVGIPGALLAAGPRPEIVGVRPSPRPGVAGRSLCQLRARLQKCHRGQRHTPVLRGSGRGCRQARAGLKLPLVQHVHRRRAGLRGHGRGDHAGRRHVGASRPRHHRPAAED